VRNTAAMARDRDDFEFFCMSAAASVEGRGVVIGLDVIVAAAGERPSRNLIGSEGLFWTARFAGAIAERGPVTLGSMRRREGKSINE
jgi:hypothetical protein